MSALRRTAGALLVALGSASLLVAVPPLDYEAVAERTGFSDRIFWAITGWGGPRVAPRGPFLAAGLGLLGLGAVAVLATLRARGSMPRPSWRAAGTLAVLAFTLVPTARGTPHVGQLLWGSAGVALVWAGLQRLVPRGRKPFARLADLLRDALVTASPRTFGGALFGAALLLTAGSSTVLFRHVPHVLDSSAQLFQARIFASGRITATPPARPEFFERTYMVTNGDRWYSMYPPGHSLVLACGVLIGAPWLVDPLLGALAVLLLWRIGAELWDERTGRLAGLLGLCSPFLIFMSSEYMNHPTALAAFLGFVFFFFRTIRDGGVAAPALAGASLGLLGMTRPLTAVGLAFPFAVYGAVGGLLGRRPRGPLVILAAVALLFGGALLAYNDLTNGSPWRLGYQALTGTGVLPGFGRSAWGPAHTAARGLDNTLANASALERGLFEWPVPSLSFVFVLFALAAAGMEERLLAASVLTLAAGNFFYWYNDFGLGPRFVYEASGPLILLSARGVVEASRCLRKRPDGPLSGRAPVVALAACVLWAALVPVPLLARLYGNDYFGGTSRVVQAVREIGLTNAVVFVNSFYPSAFSQNAPGLDGPVVYARDLPNRSVLMTLYPGRTAWREVGGRLEALPSER